MSDAPLVLSSPGLNPSNTMVKSDRFPNLARHRPAPAEIIAAVTATAESELAAAGIPLMQMRWLSENSEVPSLVRGILSMWSFERAWYYWIAEGPGLPPEVADRLHATHGQVVRVDGHCGCPSPREWFKGFACGHYHIDTPDGLKALADELRSVYDADADPDATPRTR